MTAHTDSASFLHSRESAACASISRNPYFFLLASALLRSFASRIESETTRFNRNPYQQWCGQFRGGKEEISGTVRLK
ncbi:hypothetical protein DVJ83_03260 [Deinococcus wulumuqiensis]|uniref:Uncharacterized protein n=1 Tax=Deinococcus wulumuqiensis TaxID=980427 RepID=A0A345IF72_9DEIO|nr:hypothetical protein DVJ83_03260 [Deinococcus wulumuqiensis]